jgi:hypothetical protein
MGVLNLLIIDRLQDSIQPGPMCFLFNLMVCDVCLYLLIFFDTHVVLFDSPSFFIGRSVATIDTVSVIPLKLGGGVTGFLDVFPYKVNLKLGCRLWLTVD